MYELTKPQKLIYDMEKFVGGAVANICGSILFEGEIGENRMKAAVNQLYSLNDVFRFSLVEGEDGVRQQLKDYAEQEISVLRFETKLQFESYAAEYAKVPLDTCHSLCESMVVFVENKYGILLKLHHLAGDAWTLSLIGSQLCAILRGEIPEAYSYLDYISGEKEFLASKRYETGRLYFREQFARHKDVIYLSDKFNTYIHYF